MSRSLECELGFPLLVDQICECLFHNCLQVPALFVGDLADFCKNVGADLNGKFLTVCFMTDLDLSRKPYAAAILRIRSCCSFFDSAPIVNASRTPSESAYLIASS